MKTTAKTFFVTATMLAASVFLWRSSTRAQTPVTRQGGSADTVTLAVERMMAFDKNKDGKLMRAEITDQRLAALFDRADANKDGCVTKEELIALYTRETADFRGGPPGDFGPGGPGGPGGGFGPGGLPRPGQILPDFMQGMLSLTDQQKKQLNVLQTEVDSRLSRILTADQKKQLEGFRGPGGPGGPGGPPDFPGRPN